jgi:uncharacterized protein (DUF58 family)
MAGVSDFLDQDDLRRISGIQILARSVVEGFCTGLHRSPHKGFSVEFKQHRQYVAGDELRHLDWRVYGRSDRYYIREYEEETNLRATILLDSSGSMGYGAKSPRDGVLSKHEYAKRLAACLIYLMLQQQDSVGLVTFDQAIRKYIPPRSLVSHMHILFDELNAAQPGGETEIGKVFHELVPRIQRRGLLIVISDCFGSVTEFLKSLAHFRHAGHEILVFQILHPDELEFPFREWAQFKSLEGSAAHMLDPVALREAYLANLAKFREELVLGCRRNRVDLVPFTTDTRYSKALSAYMTRRLRRA